MPDTFGSDLATARDIYTNNVMLALQQKPGRILSSMTELPRVEGKDLQAVELLASTEADVDQPETSATQLKVGQHLGIWVKPRRITWGMGVSRGQIIRNLTDYKSPYRENGTIAVRRRMQKLAIEAILSARRVASTDDGVPTAVDFDTTNQQVAVNHGGSNVGLTVPKIVKALELLGLAETETEDEKLTMLVTPKQMTDLYGQLQFTSKDYRDRSVYDQKTATVQEFIGIQIIQVTGLPQSGGHRRCPLYAMSGMHKGMAGSMVVRVGENPERQYQEQIFLECYFAATRSEDGKVADILCAEA